MGCAIDGALVGMRLLVRGMVLLESKVSDRATSFMFENCGGCGGPTTCCGDPTTWSVVNYASILSGRNSIMRDILTGQVAIAVVSF
jgi:hypothetical protein